MQTSTTRRVLIALATTVVVALGFTSPAWAAGGSYSLAMTGSLSGTATGNVAFSGANVVISSGTVKLGNPGLTYCEQAQFYAYAGTNATGAQVGATQTRTICGPNPSPNPKTYGFTMSGTVTINSIRVRLIGYDPTTPCGSGCPFTQQPFKVFSR